MLLRSGAIELSAALSPIPEAVSPLTQPKIIPVPKLHLERKAILAPQHLSCLVPGFHVYVPFVVLPQHAHTLLFQVTLTLILCSVLVIWSAHTLH